MGASGAGKTSLLNIISDRISMKSGSKLTGDVLINDKNKVSSATFGAIASFVMQDDILFEFLTVKEALTFAARLRLSSLPLFE
jgi:ABC-type multidrug transport system ATPase subunit